MFSEAAPAAELVEVVLDVLLGEEWLLPRRQLQPGHGLHRPVGQRARLLEQVVAPPRVRYQPELPEFYMNVPFTQPYIRTIVRFPPERS